MGFGGARLDVRLFDGGCLVLGGVSEGGEIGILVRLGLKCKSSLFGFN